EKKKKYKDDSFNTANWAYDKINDQYTCPNGQIVPYQYDAYRTDRYGFRRDFKVYECVSCAGCPLRDLCTKAREGNNRKIFYNENGKRKKKILENSFQKKKLAKFTANVK